MDNNFKNNNLLEMTNEDKSKNDNIYRTILTNQSLNKIKHG
jgi:hypothetical protein